MANPRIQCAKILQKILEDKVFFSDLKKQIPEKDLPFCNMLILTTLRQLTALKQILYGFLNKKIPHKHRLAEYLLLAAAAEILFMDTAEYAVINETVNNIRHNCDKFLGGMANAILRKICTAKDELRQKIRKINPLPPSFMEILNGYDEEQIQRIGQSVLEQPPLDISVKKNPQELALKMAADVLPNGSLRIYEATKVQQLPEYGVGSWWVQDAAAALPVLAMGNVAGKKVIDLCAAPGGKTAQLCAGGAEVTALDISETRLETLKQNMRRIGFENIKTQAIDALEYLRNANEKFDAVLLDAPCSATGTLRRHPEVLHIKNLQDVKEQAILQQKLLEACQNVLEINGILVYSVCSISQIEGERQIETFLQNNKNFKIVALTEAEISPYGSWDDILILPNGTIRTLPYYQSAQKGMDAFYICKLQRII